MMSFVTPEVSEAINRLTFHWATMDLKVVADRLTDDGKAELWFYHANESGDHLLHTARVNLLASNTMSALAKRMVQNSNEIPWLQIMTFLSSKAIEYQRQGEQGCIIEPSQETPTHPGYYLEPFVVRGVPNVFYGDKGVNKTTMSLLFLGLIATGQNSLGLNVQQARVAMLDWESDQKITLYTISMLYHGNAVPFFGFSYLHCKTNLPSDISHIANFLFENNAEVVLIDSLGAASGADRMDSSGKASALDFFEALRKLRLTSIIIAQNAKNEDAGKKTIFGSTYFTYYARNIFEIKGNQDELDENVKHVAMIHQESNYSKRYQPFGFRLTYSDTAIAVEPEATTMSQWYQKASQTKALLDYLKGGTKSRKAISDELGISINQTDVILSRAKKRGLIIQLGVGMWGLPVGGVESP